MLATSAHQAFHAGPLLTALGFGFRHGIDWDHIGALTDITSSQDQPRRAMWFATLYALGHALVVFVLGFAAIMFAAQLPSGVDSAMERFVGATLIILAGYVFYSVARHGREFRMRSRWMLLVTAVRTGMRWARRRARTELIEIIHDHVHPRREIHDHEHAHEPNDEHIPVHVQVSGSSAISTAGGVHRHRHRHVAAMPDDPFENYAPRTVFGIGMIHGIGAETPTQVLIFLAVAGVGEKGTGLLLLACFLIGLLAANAAVALAGTAGSVGVRGNRQVYVAVSLITALFTGAIGILFLVGSSSSLPAMLGG
jgi:ABC-type nickel/cobalt efflux system permease component RcnA